MREKKRIIELKDFCGDIAYAYMELISTDHSECHIGAILDNWRNEMEDDFDNALIHYLPNRGYCLVLSDDDAKRKEELFRLLMRLCKSQKDMKSLCPILSLDDAEIVAVTNDNGQKVSRLKWEKPDEELDKKYKSVLDIIDKIIRIIDTGYCLRGWKGLYSTDVDRLFRCSHCVVKHKWKPNMNDECCTKCLNSDKYVDNYCSIEAPIVCYLHRFIGIFLREAYRLAPGGRLRNVDKVITELYERHIPELLVFSNKSSTNDIEAILEDFMTIPEIQDWNLSANERTEFSIVTRYSDSINKYSDSEFIDLDALTQNIVFELMRNTERCSGCIYFGQKDKCEKCWRNNSLKDLYVCNREPKRDNQTICDYDCVAGDFMICCNSCTRTDNCKYVCEHSAKCTEETPCEHALFVNNKRVHYQAPKVYNTESVKSSVPDMALAGCYWDWIAKERSRKS